LQADKSNGYENVAQEFMDARSNNGLNIIRNWASGFRPADSILDLGCGNGIPITQVLLEAELTVSAIDASPTMVAAFQQNYPQVEVVCEAVQTSSFFHRKFDGILAIGLIFLLSEDDQIQLLNRMAHALSPKGRLLFTSPHQICSWEDILTEQISRSLGAKAYKGLLHSLGLEITGEYIDEGQSYYFAAEKP